MELPKLNIATLGECESTDTMCPECDCRNRVEDYFKKVLVERHTDLRHMIDIIRNVPVTDEVIIQNVLDLYFAGKVRFAQEGSHIPGSPADWNDERWELAQHRGNFFNTCLRSAYRMGFKKAEIVRLRYIMRQIERITGEREEFAAWGYVHANWGFVRYRPPSLISSE